MTLIAEGNNPDTEKRDSNKNLLKKGNRQSVIIEQNGNEQKHLIETNPQFKKCKSRIMSMEEVTKEDLQVFCLQLIND